ncbi:MAG: sterol desaturase family protein [Verrucomicrobiota bacterium]
MGDLLELIANAYGSYAGYLWREVTTPHWGNYLYWLFALSFGCFLLEWNRPWRADQPRFRKDFWLDAFYMLFNFFLFSLIIYHAASQVVVNAFQTGLGNMGIENFVALRVDGLPVWGQLLLLLVIKDFVHWNVHRLLHRVPFLWEFHKVHHSVQEMGFAAHLRFHWMETVVYKTLEYLPLALIGFGIDDFLLVHLFTLAVGHFNHSNIRVPLGPLRFVLNNPQMHIWHHARELPKGHPYGVNFGLTLSVWDYLFRTAHIPEEGRDVELGFPGVESFPKTFWAQVMHGFGRKHDAAEKG